jgi:hypothetical protein
MIPYTQHYVLCRETMTEPYENNRDGPSTLFGINKSEVQQPVQPSLPIPAAQESRRVCLERSCTSISISTFVRIQSLQTFFAACQGGVEEPCSTSCTLLWRSKRKEGHLHYLLTCVWRKQNNYFFPKTSQHPASDPIPAPRAPRRISRRCLCHCSQCVPLFPPRGPANARYLASRCAPRALP